MGGLKIKSLLSFLSLAAVTFAAPSASTSTTTNATSACDTTGEDVVQFTIDLEWGDVNPTGGVSRKAILTNGTMPGPALKMKQGQTVEFTVINNLPNLTSIHFHGITQKDTPWSDGVPGVTQKPIPAGETYTYKWTATDSGTYFYHAHYKGQMMDGLAGAIIIAPADNADTPFKLISNATTDINQMSAAALEVEPVFISDWVQYTFDEFWQIQKDANIDNACMDSIILNGMGSVYCLSAADIVANQNPAIPSLLGNGSLTAKGCIPANTTATQGNFQRNLAALPPAAYDVCTPSTGDTFTYTVDAADGWAAMSFINSGGFALLKLTIDSHKLYVYEINGHYVVPQIVDQVPVSNGDRVSFLIKLDQQAGAYPIRVANNGLNQVVSGFGAVIYKGNTAVSSTAVSAMNYGGLNLTAITILADKKAAPYPAFPVSQTADAMYLMNIKKEGAPAGAYEWTLSGVNEYNMTTDDQSPLLYQDVNSIVASDTLIKTQKDTWIDLIVRVQGPLAAPHPMHKHGNKAFVLGYGTGNWTWGSVAEAAAALPAGQINLVNPAYRDTFTTMGAQGNNTWMALRYKADQPGAWIFHCHMQTHFSGGMAVVLLDGVNAFPTVPTDVGTCSASGSPYANSTSSSSTKSSSSSSSTGTGTTSSKSSTSSTVAYTGAANTISSSLLMSLFAVFIAVFAL